MPHNNIETSVHLRRSDLTPREMLIAILEDEGDVIGWEEEALIQQAAMRLEGSPEVCLRMARLALNGLLKDAVVMRDGRLICLSD